MIFISTIFSCKSQNSLVSIGYGVNLTGLERTWEFPEFDLGDLKKKLLILENNGVKEIRLPLSFNYHFESDPHFPKKIKRVIAFCSRRGLKLVLANFDHQLTEENADQQTNKIIDQWLILLDFLPKNAQNVYLEIVNEPTVSPTTWHRVSNQIISEIRKKNNAISIVVGASNANSMFELSRMEPYPFENLIYTFHYYEPYIFTHQGTSWTGDQHATVDIPYPYDERKMPNLSPKSKETAGEVNFRDYNKTGNLVAVEDKISQIAAWAKTHGVALWCTEYGVTVNADHDSRVNYLKDVGQILTKYAIPSFIWEWEGNFGVKGLIEISSK
ncbi:glycoside hydrolase family 5 protein [Belliella kenyensis]|uniref:Glycoside hydrolase family 5 protein n=1 Tax=Belliella kenyensis TaxID=1472724 RepID=A0ABV8EKP8_9BACT|nr:cellulase family glycosylhydrolase [Belliella kenyensis]MDN3603732.1 cellulase family glycosylhydrolase [Belliella kenyensis]